jgi:predicted hotdog family 3-hydroxylacyl-ACP dehydratase
VTAGADPGFPPVRELVPQRPPMLLLDRVLAWEGDGLVCAATVAAEWLLVEGDAMPAAGLLEVMAQAVAALHGLQGRARGEPVRVGLLLGCRELTLHAPRVRVGEALTVRAAQSFGMDALAEFRCTVEGAAGRLAEGTLHVVRGDLEAQPA